MSVGEFFALITGPVGAIVVLAVAVYSLVTMRFVIPAPIYRAAETRIEMLDKEAEAQLQMIRRQSEQLTEQRISNAKLEARIEALTTEAERLSEEIHKLTGEIEKLRKVSTAREERAVREDEAS